MEIQPLALAPCRLLLFLASYLVPLARRDEWVQEWWAELWHRRQALVQQGEWRARTAVQLYLNCLGAFRDAWAQLTQDTERWTSFQMQVRSPVFCGTLLGLSLACLFVVTGYFPATRTILSELPFSNGPRLALVSRTGRLEAIRGGIPRKLADSWLQNSKILEAMAACSSIHSIHGLIGKHVLTASSLQGTANLLDVIGQPISPQVQQSLQAGDSVAFLSFSFWQGELHQNPGIIGHRFRHDHRSSLVAGVLPPHFWFLSPSIQIYELGDKAVGNDATLVVRSKPDVSANQLEAELLRTADHTDSPFARTAPHVLFLSDAVRTPVWLFGWSLLMATVLLGIEQRSCFLRRDGSNRRREPRSLWRWWSFLIVKAGMALLLVFIIGIELSIGRGHLSAAEALGGPALLWFYTTACTAVLFAIFVDQHSRCRVCLRCLAFPIHIGSPGCLFLDWSGTELLCPEGHGVLYVPDHLSCWDNAERWIALEF